ncbi:MAG: hypothetical protein JWQ89_668 [Devosia sp.]|uniref:glycosyltransferase family 4 protein n=1 Tax=Devosia sp. TaxID=1871048 RepID=UPI00262B5817|nr:glycosyltransferase family 4 protein [Devosia sp.]MDB5538941.1 hypothetical protein [Devosia sp.]
MSSVVRKRVLLSAFACSPLRGSEDGVGWRWVLEVARLGHDVTVLTRRRYKSEIEAAKDAADTAGLVRFIYVDLAPWASFYGLGKPIGYFYIYVWQLHALMVARRLHREQAFDLVHHITFGGIRFPTFLGALGVPMIFGPVGGGETAPRALRRGYPMRGKVVDGLRDLSNALVRYDPLIQFAFDRATKIVLRTPDSVPLVPARHRHKVLLEREVGIDCGREDENPREPVQNTPRVLYVGRNLYWKGMHLGLPAFARLVAAFPKSQLTIVGSGPERRTWQRISQRLGIADHVRWIDRVDFHKMGEVYAAHDILLIPSLHDAGANVIYEAASHRLPIVCLDLGASRVLVDPSFGIKVPVRGRGEAPVIDEMATAMIRLAGDPGAWTRLSSNARHWAEQQSWASRVRNVYGVPDDDSLVPEAVLQSPSADERK